jgi:hypothetical protein
MADDYFEVKLKGLVSGKVADKLALFYMVSGIAIGRRTRTIWHLPRTLPFALSSPRFSGQLWDLQLRGLCYHALWLLARHRLLDGP